MLIRIIYVVLLAEKSKFRSELELLIEKLKKSVFNLRTDPASAEQYFQVTLIPITYATKKPKQWCRAIAGSHTIWWKWLVLFCFSFMVTCHNSRTWCKTTSEPRPTREQCLTTVLTSRTRWDKSGVTAVINTSWSTLQFSVTESWKLINC